MLKFNPVYFILAIGLFLIELYIATFEHGWIRSYFGDVLVVILIYCTIKAFFNSPVFPTAIGVLIFSFLIEFAQYFKIVSLLGLQQNKIARIVIGTTYHWLDLVSYTIGIILIIAIEWWRKRRPST